MSVEINYFTANWKLDGNRKTARVWVDGFASPKGRELLKPENRLIVAPPIELLSTVADQIQAYGLPIAVAAQDLDPKAEALFYDKKGVKHTGQAYVPALIADCAEYVILRHSETGMDKLLTNNDINFRLDIARKHNLKPIVCVSNLNQARAIAQHDPNFPGIIAYEPIEFVGTKSTAPVEQANNFCAQLEQMYPLASRLYGGGVDETTIKELLSQSPIDGVLIGNRSSGIDFFQNIIRVALS